MPVATSQQPARFGRSSSRSGEPVLITAVEPSLDEQHAARKKRYAITMGIRGVCIVLAAVFHQILWLMLAFAVLGGTVLLARRRRRPRGPRSRRAREEARTA